MNDGMDIKPRPNHRLYIKILRRMTPEERLTEALELSQFSRQLFSEGLRRRFPYLPEEELKTLIKESGEMPQSELVKGSAWWLERSSLS